MRPKLRIMFKEVYKVINLQLLSGSVERSAKRSVMLRMVIGQPLRPWNISAYFNASKLG